MLDKIKSLSKDTLIYGVSTIVGRFLNFMLVPLYTNIFPPGEFGVVANIFAYIAILNVFFTLGLESGYFKFASTLEVGSEKENFSLPFIGIFFNSLILSLILFLFSSDFSYIFQIDISRKILIKYTAVILFFDAVAIVPFAYLRLKNKPKLFASIKFINILINVVGNVILIIFLKYGIEAVFISNIFASIITIVLLLPVIISNFEISFNKKLLSELFRFSLPYIPSGISSNIVQVINRPILTALTNDTTVGIFQANYRLGIFMMLFVSMFEFAWRPFFLNNAKFPDAKKLFAKVMTIFILLASFIFIILTLFIEDIATFKIPFKGYLIGKAYWGGLAVVPLVLMAYLIYGIYINLMAGIYIEKKTKYLPLITGIAAIINIIFNFLLIPDYGIIGAGVTTLISYLAMTVGIYVVSQKYYYIKYDYLKILFIFLCTGITLVIFYSFKDVFPVHLLFKAILAVFFLLLMFLFKILDIKSFKKVLSV
jgi:O-antigen/teichoic acid export membrane protein